MNNSKIQVSELTWDEKGLPHSVLFDDKYFCEEDGLLESRYVFCGGNELEKRWKDLPKDRPGVFYLFEAGFGTGLNFLCAWELWQQCAPKNWKLHYSSVDQYPLSKNDLSKSLDLWPDLKNFSHQLIDCYPEQKEKVHDLYFADKAVQLTLIFDHILNALDQTSGKVINAWFLDGFAPSKNPEMWSEELFAKMARLSQVGTTCSTFTVAGSVRRGLELNGFTTIKADGFGKKRHMLKGVYTKQ